ncbi:TIGR01906 family membrane protein [Alkaliphilus serpentinus]|uniref:TIGR01906 family membrane protein n=1 Tax=Alkaliphilus serpentinus TaxID=1482731 RepID=A0A833HRI3_9FIRM|nr:TIGR01906 family membrane protein [Alkaliphilus serpentinus]KAB3533180.1 TIGR01906 family membrane protein [Alkaliphilus serpentinus]
MKSKFLYLIIGILLSIILLLTSVEVIAFNMNHYRSSYEKYNISSETGMDLENYQFVVKDLLSYLRNEKAVLNTRAIVRGEEIEIFGEREKLHMIDVKELFIKGRDIRNIGLIVLVLMVITLLKKDRRWKRNFSRTMFYTAIVNILLLALFSGLIYFDFNKYFTYFHLIFFDNDLWILDPQTDILIQMVPEAFFYNTAIKIISIFIASISILAVTGCFLRRKFKNIPFKATVKEEEVSC